MLPLWIIDLCKPTERRDAFLHLLSQLEHVHIQSANSNGDAESWEMQETHSYDLLRCAHAPLQQQSLRGASMRDRESQEAELRNYQRGDYWWYSPIDNNLQGEDGTDATIAAQKLYDLQCRLVSEGQQFIRNLRSSNIKPYQTISVIVLADATEDLSQKVFASIAAMLQKEKGRIVANHIHQGMEIFGMLFIPSDTNSRHVSERKNIQRMLNELEVQHAISSIRGYDHVILWQDVQNRTENTYPILNQTQQAEYLLQCLIHLFLATDRTHPLISGTGAADTFFLSIGATSVFYDVLVEDQIVEEELQRNLLNTLKSQGQEEKYNEDLQLIEKNEYSPFSLHIMNDIASYITNMIVDDTEEEPPLHPIRNMWARRLERDYYRHWLRYMPANLMHSIIAKVEEKVNPKLETIAADSQRTFKDAQRHLKDRIDRCISTITHNDGGLPLLKYLLRDMQEKLADNSEQIQGALEKKFWMPLQQEVIPRELQEDFLDIHDAYREDIRLQTGGKKQAALRSEALATLRHHLGQKNTVLSHIGRTFLLSIVLLLTTLPLFRLFTHYAVWWMFPVCIIPMLIQLTIWLRQQRKIRFALRRLKAYYLHEAYARVANRIAGEAQGFYTKLIHLAGEYIGRIEHIQREVVILTNQNPQRAEIPVTTFNQPLHGGLFAGRQLLDNAETRDCMVRVNYSPKKFLNLTPTDYFLLINQFHKDIMLLFDDVYLTTNFMKEFDPETGEERLLSKAEQEDRKRERWQQKIQEFKTALAADMAYILVPRDFPSVGEKLQEYSRQTQRRDVLLPAIDMAAANGELISSADNEYADIKTNLRDISTLCAPYLPVSNTKYQIEPYDHIYQKYMFITRWQSFEHLPLNRILPTEDFDTNIREQLVYQEEQKAVARKNKKKNTPLSVETPMNATHHTEQTPHAELVSASPLNNVNSPQETLEAYHPQLSSLLLWALCPDDTSSLWFRLFSAKTFTEALADRQKYREILNQED